MAALTIGELVGYLKIEDRSWRRGLAAAHKGLNLLRGGLVTAGQHSLAFTAKMLKLAIVAGSAASAVGGLLQVVAGLGPALVHMAAAGAAVAAAALAGLVAVTATVKLGVSGMSEAFAAAASGDMAAYREALKKLAPAAADFVVKIRSLKPALDQLKLDVQQKLFKGLGDEVKKTAVALLPVAHRQFTSLASILNVTAREVLAVARSSENLKTLRDTVENITAGFNQTTRAAAPLTQALIDIVNAGSSQLPRIGEAIGSAAERFGDFIHEAQQSDELQDWFQAGIDKAVMFGRALRDFGAGIRNIFRIGSDAGGGFLVTLASIASKFRAFTESMSGSSAIRTVFEAIRSLSQSFGVFLRALEPLLPVVARLAKVLGEQLGRILEELGPVIAEVGTVLVDALIEVLPDVAPLLIALAKGFGEILKAASPLIKPLVKLIEAALVPLIDPIVKLAQTVVPPLVRIIEKLTPVIETLAKVLGGIINIIGPVVEGFLKLGEAAASVLSGTGDALGTDFIGSAASAVRRQGPGLFQAVTDTVDAAVLGMDTPLADQAGRRLVQRYLDGIFGKRDSIFGTVRKIIDDTLNIFNGRQNEFDESGKRIVAGFTNGMTAEQERAFNAARQAINGLLNIFNGRSAEHEAAGRRIAAALGGGVQSSAGGVASAAQRVVDAVRGVFGGSGDWLVDAGRRIINGFIGGVQSRTGFLRSVLNQITSLIPSWKGPPERDAKLLYPSGQLLLRGLVGGVESQVPVLQRALSGVTARIPAMAGVPAMGADPAGGGSSSGPAVVEFRSGGSDVDDFLLRWLQRVVREAGGVKVVFQGV